MMTDETRETHAKALDDLVQDAATNLYPEMTDARVFACLAGAAALRDVLIPRTCGNCTHATDEHTRGTVEHGYVAVVCVKRGGIWRADDGCIRGWQAREGDA